MLAVFADDVGVYFTIYPQRPVITISSHRIASHERESQFYRAEMAGTGRGSAMGHAGRWVGIKAERQGPTNDQFAAVRARQVDPITITGIVDHAAQGHHNFVHPDGRRVSHSSCCRIIPRGVLQCQFPVLS